MCTETLRDYFIAHAPPAPSWFRPAMPAFPEEPENKEAVELIALRRRTKTPEENLPIEEKELLERYRSEMKAWHKAVTEFEEMRTRETLLQWPLYWADQMLKRRQQPI